MSNVPVIDCVRHYQRSIERANNDEKKVLHCFAKLYKLPITVEHLSETGIGKTVNNFRKVEGEVGLTAKALVAKWKTMVADARESTPEEQEGVQEYEPAHRGVNNNEQDNHRNSIKPDKSHQHKSRHEHKKHESLNHKEKDRNYSKDGERLGKEKERQRHDKQSIEQNLEKRQNEHKKDKTDQQQPTTSNTETKEMKREKQKDTKKEDRTHKHNKHERHKEHKHDKSTGHRENDLKHHHKSSSGSGRTEKRANKTEMTDEIAMKRVKISNKSEETADEGDDDGIDSSMGANFEDVLGALNMSAGSSRKLKKSATNSTHSKHISTSNKSKISESACSSKKAAELQKPLSLTSAVKLQPLDPNLTLELPTISNNYRPMPLNKTVMDCVFNNTNNGNSNKTQVRMLSDSAALAHGISSKTMRTKIYSGVKSGQVFQVPSLFNLCIRMLQKNIDALEYTGGVPYEVLKPVLERATPEQLYVFEEYNPYILEDSDELWKLHVQRKYRTQKRQEMEAWREMFMRCREDEAQKLSRLTETIKQKEKIVSAPIKKTQMAYVDCFVKPPRNVARKQEIYGTRAKLIATPAARVAALSSVTPNAATIGDVRLRVAASTSRETAHATSSSNSRPKKAPLMAKTLQLMRGRLKR